MKSAPIWIWGFHSVEVCLEVRPELVLEIQMSPEARDENAVRLETKAREAGLKIVRTPRLPRFGEDARPQGVAARLRGFPVESAWGALDSLETETADPGQWLVLDRIQDPRNFGAILRSAAAFGVRGVFFGTREQAPVTATVAVASAGQLFRLRLLEAANLGQVCERFKEAGALLMTLEMGGQDLETALARTKASQFVWVVGSEGRGVRPGLSTKAEEKVSIPMATGIESLNASVAASIALYRTWSKIRCH